MASATTTDFVATATKSAVPPFSLIEQKSLLARLAEELARTSREFARDPRGFLRDLFADDTKDARRRRLIYFGLAGALVIHAVLLTVIAVIGWHSLTTPKETLQVITLPSFTSESAKVEEPKANIPHGKKDAGGGHGGETHSAPATKGPLPQSSPQPQIVKLTAPNRPLPSLPVPATVVGPDSPLPAVNVPIGIPTGVLAEAPAPGAGNRGGLGGGNDTGAGTNDGPGGGPGKRGKGTSQGNGGVPNGTDTTPAVIDWRSPPKIGYTPFAWTHLERAVITPEAQENKVIGEVVMRATLNANGTITDIELVTPVPYMNESAIEALKRCRFRPATVNGVPITLTHVLIRHRIHY